MVRSDVEQPFTSVSYTHGISSGVVNCNLLQLTRPKTLVGLEFVKIIWQNICESLRNGLCKVVVLT